MCTFKRTQVKASVRQVKAVEQEQRLFLALRFARESCE